MRYNWDINEIRNDIKRMEELVKNNQEDELILDHVKQYHMMLSCVIKGENEELDSNEISIRDLNKYFFEDITKKDCELADLLIDSYDIVENYTSDDLATIAVCNNDILIKNTEHFLKEYTNEHIYGKYLKLRQENPNYLHITKLENSNSKSHGITFNDSIFRKKKIILFRDNTFMDLVSLPHELFHAIFNDYDCDKRSSYQSYYVSEIEGSFANLLTTEFYREALPDISKECEEHFLLEYKEQLKELIVNFSYLSSCNNSNNLRKNKFKKILGHYNLRINNEEKLRSYMTDTCEEIMNYALSYLASIDLLEIYKKDKEFALYLLKNICYTQQDNDVLGILRRNHITFMDNDYKNFKEYVKKIEGNQSK